MVVVVVVVVVLVVVEVAVVVVVPVEEGGVRYLNLAWSTGFSQTACATIPNLHRPYSHRSVDFG